MTKKTNLINIRLDEKEDEDFREAIKIYNSKSPFIKVTITSIIRQAIIKFIKKTKK